VESRPRRGDLTAIDAALTLLGVLLVVQIWLLTATLESYLAGHHDVVVPGLGASALLVLACLALYGFVRRVDREVRRTRREG
jgi:hypothetical protein